MWNVRSCMTYIKAIFCIIVNILFSKASVQLLVVNITSDKGTHIHIQSVLYSCHKPTFARKLVHCIFWSFTSNARWSLVYMRHYNGCHSYGIIHVPPYETPQVIKYPLWLARYSCAFSNNSSSGVRYHIMFVDFFSGKVCFMRWEVWYALEMLLYHLVFSGVFIY